MLNVLPLPEVKQVNLTLPLVAAQPGIWMADQIASQRNVFTIAHYIEINGELDRSLFDAAIRQGLSEADTIHARYFVNEEGIPVQQIPTFRDAQQVIAPEWFDFSHEQGENASQELMQTDLAAELPADGERPLYRQVIMKVGAQPERWFWYQRFHHLMLDGFSFEALTRRIIDIYNALSTDRQSAENPFCSFEQVVKEYQDWDQSPAKAETAAFWQQHTRERGVSVSLSTEDIVNTGSALPLHYDCHFPVTQFASLGEDDLLRKFQPAEIAMAALCIYFYRMSGEKHLSIGFPFMRRLGSQALCAMGPVVNLLPLQIKLQSSMTLAEVARAFVDEIKQVRRYQRYEAEQLRCDLGLSGSNNALYGPVFNYKIYNETLKLGGKPIKTHTLAMGPVDDLEFELCSYDDQLHLTLIANRKKYSEQTLQWHGERISYLLNQLLIQPQQPIAFVPIIPPQEQQRLDEWSCGPKIQMPVTSVSVLDLFLQQVERQPDVVAIRCGNEQLSYHQLMAKVMQFARFLLSQGIGAEDVVAIGIPRSVDSVVAILGVLASGAAYIPLDLDYPQERLQLMCDDVQPVLLITHLNTRAQMPEISKTICLDDHQIAVQCASLSSLFVTDEERREKLRSEHLAYMIYTSGSTGKPKGVMSTHGGLLNLLTSHAVHLFGPAIENFHRQHGRRARAGHTASFSFDSSWEPLFCMILGSELYIFDEELRRDAWGVIQQMNLLPVDIMDITPSFLTQLIDSGLLEKGNHQPAFIMIGGEAATPRLWELLKQQPQIDIHNYYGPSEYTIDTLGASIQVSEQPVIGRPVANTDIWLLDSCLQPVPTGAVGELYLSGAGIARGYLHRPGLTATRFIANPFRHGEVMYRSGDLMRWQSDGQLAFIGRVDHQIKVRGFRVELGEVENALADLPEVSSAVVIAEPIGATYRLLGYCAVPDGQRRALPDLSAQLLAELAKKLPDYMVPSRLMVLETLPLTVNGKIDRGALPKSQKLQLPVGRKAKSEQEKSICEAFVSLLGVQEACADDDFFVLGGDSISAMALGTQLRRLGWQLRPRDIFSERTPARMALKMMPVAIVKQTPARIQKGAIDSLPILHWFAESHGINTRFAHGVFIRVPAELQPQHLSQALTALVQAHPVLRASTRDNQLIVGESIAVPEGTYCSTWQNCEDIETCAEQAFHDAVMRLDPARGQLFYLCLLQNSGVSKGLVFVIHHLATDGVSWRILLDELRQGVEAAITGKSMTLPAEEYTLYDWNDYLRQNLPQRAAELPFWQSMLDERTPLLGLRPLNVQRDRRINAREERTLLSCEQTAALLGILPNQYHANVEEILLTILAMACYRHFHASKLRFQLESHGRIELDQTGDLARTVGWMTAEYPIVVDLLQKGECQPVEVVRAVKSVLRAVPDRGIGYGLLRYLDQTGREIFAPQETPEILFNYLGRFIETDNLWAPQRTRNLFRDAFAVYQDPEMFLNHSLEINLFVDEQGNTPQLVINWQWVDGIFSHRDIAELHRGMAWAADSLIQFARQQPEQAVATLVAAEVGLSGVEESDLTQLSERYGSLSAVLPLLPLQQGLLFHAQTATEHGSYNSLTRLSLSGPLTVTELRRALLALIRHHPQLAAQFDTEQNAAPLQLIPIISDDKDYWAFDFHQLPELTLEEEDIALRELEKAELMRDLFQQPVAMLHALLVRHGKSLRYTLLLNAHHLVVDGWSTPILVQDLLTLLNQGAQALHRPEIRYQEVVHQLLAREAEPTRQCWKQLLKGVQPTCLFGEHPHTGEVKALEILLEPAMEQALIGLCQQRGLTINTLMQGVWSLLLSIHSGSSDVVFGSPVSGRFGQTEGLDQHIGLFSNTLPVRVILDMAQPLLPQLEQLQAQQIQLIEHDNIGLGEIQQIAGTSTLFDTLLVVENYPVVEQNQGNDEGIVCQGINNCGYTHYPLTLLVLPGKRLRLLMEYRPSVKQPERLAQRILLLIQQLIEQPEIALRDWVLQTVDEAALIEEVNNTYRDIPSKTLHQTVIEQARKRPDDLALLDCHHRLTYQQMRLQTRLLVDRLIEAGVQPGDIVGVALARSVRLSLALQAILEAGAAWLPLDTAYPDERLTIILKDAQPRLVITESEFQARFANQALLLLLDKLADETQQPIHLAANVTPEHTAYIIYTSGSTGQPKGVMVSHQAIVNRLLWMQDTYQLTADDVVLQKTPCSFDVSVWEFFWPLMTGAQLMMAPPEAHRDPATLLQLIDDYRVTTLHFVPSMLATLMDSLVLREQDAPFCHSLRRVFCSGEALSCELARRYQTLVAAPLHNLYGPTEAAVDVTWQPASGDALERCTSAGVPIGRPVWNTQLRILDTWLRPVPIGVAGDLYLSGIQLATNYLNRADLTASRFVADPFVSGKRMYRTGDIACWSADGEVEYLGRSDDQLKIRGQRIELGEIEQVLLEQPGVAQAAVAARELGKAGQAIIGQAITGPAINSADARQLIAWLIPQSGVVLDIEALHQTMTKRLPVYMLPVSYVIQESFPLSANGKLNRKALPIPEKLTTGRLPRAGLESQMAGLFAEILACDTVWADDDFFALGGHSLLAMRLAAEIRRRFNHSVSVGHIMVTRSVEKLSALLVDDQRQNSAENRGAGEVLPLREGIGPALFCVHPASGFAWQYSGLLRYLEGNWPIIGLQSPRPRGVIADCDSLDAMCTRHLATLRSIQPHGPYYLLGYSLGGMLAQGMAIRLQQEGEEVAFLGLLDAYPPEGQDWGGLSEEEAKQEIAREQAEFMATTEDERDPQLRMEKQAMFEDIVANYRDAVRSLLSAVNQKYDGEATLFVATRTLPSELDVEGTWAPWIRQLKVYRQDCEHADILSPVSLEQWGPLLNNLLKQCRH
ncbi:amino acid adenylation domain-containing protein [Xenorhabdus hominickii]|uniref:Chrysobactin synthetase cbsF n=1 Tax=Xenorhabdus hominickii TaxID=351679 RepID=A0A2G0QDK5_XENHO|nr:non-ribosomal peptide synthetase [Xenorhabdus hominickii]AOM41383.1 non-ribosomal peptide synthetase [Xenorhabdus hominickii]PHM55344.1 chrysobactin synthetase cbsF [Xenorhabdus hominickii]PHM57291.1 chrysobactin synthetase cbsF [Xenorhabdus hominickii]